MFWRVAVLRVNAGKPPGQGARQKEDPKNWQLVKMAVKLSEACQPLRPKLLGRHFNRCRRRNQRRTRFGRLSLGRLLRFRALALVESFDIEPYSDFSAK